MNFGKTSVVAQLLVMVGFVEKCLVTRNIGSVEEANFCRNPFFFLFSQDRRYKSSRCFKRSLTNLNGSLEAVDKSLNYWMLNDLVDAKRIYSIYLKQIIHENFRLALDATSAGKGCSLIVHCASNHVNQYPGTNVSLQPLRYL